MQKPSSSHHAETTCNGLLPFCVFPRMVFPSIAIIFLSFSPSLLFNSSCHFDCNCCIVSGAIIAMTRCIVSCDGTPFSSVIYLLKYSLCCFAKSPISTQSSAFANVANNTITKIFFSLCLTLLCCRESSMQSIHSSNSFILHNTPYLVYHNLQSLGRGVLTLF